MGCALFWWHQSIALEKVTQGWWPRKILKVHASAWLQRCNKFMLSTEFGLCAIGFPLCFPFGRKILKVHESAWLPRCNKFMLSTEHVLSALGFPLGFPLVRALAKPESGPLRRMSSAISRVRGKFEIMFQNV